MLEIAGQVVVERTGAALPGVVVQGFDVANARSRTGPLTDADATWVMAEPSLGSAVTDGTGSFAWTVERREGGPAVKVALVVLGAGDTTGSDVLHVVAQTRTTTRGPERYQISLPAGRLRSVVGGAPGSARAELADAHQRAITAEQLRVGARRTRSRAAGAVRANRLVIQDTVVQALVERAVRAARDSTGALPAGMVPAGTPARRHARDLFAAALLTQARPMTALGLVDLSDDEAQALLDANGAPRSSVDDDDIRRVLFGVRHLEGPPARHRRDLLQVACRVRTSPSERCGEEGERPGGASPSGEEDGGEEDGGDGGNGGPATLRQIKTLLAELLEGTAMLGVLPGLTSTRTNAERIGRDLRALTIGGGPADAVALFDFERLFLAAELPVRPLVDPRVVDEITDAADAIATLGGDLAPHLGRGLDIIGALEAEAHVVAAADPYRRPDRSRPTLRMFPWNPAQTISDLAGDLLGDASAEHGRFAELHVFLEDLRRLRTAGYGFAPFATDESGPAVTVGLVVGYRQRWEPRGYQAGELVKTVPLAPKSVIKYATRRKTARTYTDKRAQASESTYSTEAQDVQRDIAKVVRDTKVSTSFTLTHEAGASVPGVASGSTTSVWSAGAERTSSATKEAFREETRKQTESLKQSSSVEVTLSAADELEVQESSEIANANEELVVTYLFYELQRRFLVSEHLHRVTPVVLVAQPLPLPSELDEAWLTRHDWIVRRVLLDPSFLPAVDYAVSGMLVADQGRATELEAALDRQASLLASLQRELADLGSADLLPDPRNIFEQFKVRVYDERYGREWREDEDRVREVFGDDVADRVAERREAEARVTEDLKREAVQLDRATTAYTEAFTRYAEEAIQVERLLLHVKDNILYYQQAIWEHETRDQRYLRLRHTPVPRVTGTLSYQLAPSGVAPRPPTWRAPLEVTVTSNLALSGEAELGDVADLATPLGYVGNAMVFPLMRWDPLVEFLMAPFASALTGLVDPDDSGNATLSELEQIVCCLKEQLSRAAFDQLKPGIDAAWAARVADPTPDADELVLPTGSLFIEALPGAHPVLEDFKLLHRALDVQVVAADLVTKRLEQLRMAARLVSDVLDDPDVDKQINVVGGGGVLVTPTDE